MALPSQSARSTTNGRTTMSRKGKPSARALFAGGGVVAVIAVAGWALTRSGDGHGDVSPPKMAVAPEQAPAGAPGVPEAPARVMAVDTPTNPEPTPPPVFELRQGVGQPGIAPGEVAAATPEPPETNPAQAQGAVNIPAPPPAAQLTVPPMNTSGLPTDLAAKLSAARSKDSERDWVAARLLYSQALADARLSEAEKAGVRDRLGVINEELVFSPKLAKDDPFAQFYEVQSGDTLTRIGRRLDMAADWRLLQRINHISNASSIRVGQKLKVIRDPFHVVVNKSAFRMDVYLGPSQSPEKWVYVRSFRVGLGDPEKYETTPVGDFKVRDNSKLVNPMWRNPGTGEVFEPNNPKNPIGEHWIGLEGLGEAAAYAGYGIHGTIDPESIGQQRSMGCVRMQADDVALVYELLTEQGSMIQIRP